MCVRVRMCVCVCVWLYVTCVCFFLDAVDLLSRQPYHRDQWTVLLEEINPSQPDGQQNRIHIQLGPSSTQVPGTSEHIKCNPQ